MVQNWIAINQSHHRVVMYKIQKAAFQNSNFYDTVLDIQKLSRLNMNHKGRKRRLEKKYAEAHILFKHSNTSTA